MDALDVRLWSVAWLVNGDLLVIGLLPLECRMRYSRDGHLTIVKKSELIQLRLSLLVTCHPFTFSGAVIFSPLGISIYVDSTVSVAKHFEQCLCLHGEILWHCIRINEHFL